jgi:hypothetical protein
MAFQNLPNLGIKLPVETQLSFFSINLPHSPAYKKIITIVGSAGARMKV